MKKLGSIPITILVIGVFLICTLALISFILASLSMRNAFAGVTLVEKLNSDIEDYSVNSDFSNFNTKVDSLGRRIFYQEKIDTSILPWKEDRLIFSVEFPVS